VFDYITFPSFTHTTGMTHFLEAPYKLEQQSVLCKEIDFFVTPVQNAGTRDVIELRICSVKPRDIQSKHGALRAADI